MSDKVKDAAVRWRRLLAGERAEDVYRDVSDNWEAPTLRMIDTARLAEAYLAENAADDEEPPTVEWLLANGFTSQKSPAGGSYFKLVIRVQEHGFGELPTHHWLCVHEPQDDWWPIDLWQHNERDPKPSGVSIRSWEDRTTRGHVRRLCSALGISLRESK